MTNLSRVSGKHQTEFIEVIDVLLSILQAKNIENLGATLILKE